MDPMDPMDPDLRSMIEAWLAGEGPNPFGSSSGGSIPYLMPEDPNTFGTQDYINNRLTMQNKANNIAMDPVFRVQMGSGPGGYSPEQYQDQGYEYERVQSPALNLLTTYSQSNNPVEQIIADAFMQGGGALDAESQIRLAWNDPEDPYHQSLRQNVALVDPETGDLDVRRIQDMVGQVRDTVIKDDIFPSFSQQGFDQAATDPVFADGTVKKGGQYVIGPDGQAYQRKRAEPTEAQRVLNDMGIQSHPYETYDPDGLASQERLDQEALWDSTYEDARKSAASIKAMRDQMDKYMVEGVDQAAPASGLREDPSFVGDLGDIAGSLAGGAAQVAGAGAQAMPGPLGQAARTIPGLAGEVVTTARRFSPGMPSMPDVGGIFGGVRAATSVASDMLNGPTRPRAEESAPSQPSKIVGGGIKASQGPRPGPAPTKQWGGGLKQSYAGMGTRVRNAEVTETNALWDHMEAEQARRQRDAYVRSLAAAGFTQFNREMGGIQGNIYGG